MCTRAGWTATSTRRCQSRRRRRPRRCPLRCGWQLSNIFVSRDKHIVLKRNTARNQHQDSCVHVCNSNTSAPHTCAQKSKQLSLETHQALMDVCCLWCWLKPHLQKSLDETMMAKMEEMWLAGLLDLGSMAWGLGFWRVHPI